MQGPGGQHVCRPSQDPGPSDPIVASRITAAVPYALQDPAGSMDRLMGLGDGVSLDNIQDSFDSMNDNIMHAMDGAGQLLRLVSVGNRLVSSTAST